MPQPPNVRSKSPRQLVGDRVVFEPSLDHAVRWGQTSSTIAPASDDSRDSDGSPTPPPVAVTLGVPGAPRLQAHVEPEAFVEPALAPRPRWPLWVAASAATAAVFGLMALLPSTGIDGAATAALGGGVANGSAATSTATRPLAPTPTMVGERTSQGPADAARRTSAVPENVERIDNERHIPIGGGVMHLPSTFAPREGGYDLVVHFHGDVKIVKESIEHAGVNAAVAIVNLGISSKPYETAYQDPTRFERLLAQVQAGITQRGYRNVELRRLSLNAWSGGYAAVESVLESRRAPDAENDPLDAVMLFDGIHSAFLNQEKTQVAEVGLLPFVRAARAAADRRILFTLTHSQIDPIEYAGTESCANLLLRGLDKTPEAATGSAPEHVKLKAAAISIGRNTKLEPTTDTRIGDFHVMGFRGITPEAHAAHLLQMGEVGLPELAARWAEPAPPRRHPIGDESASTGRKLPSMRSILDERKRSDEARKVARDGRSGRPGANARRP
ncbi:MAG: hypothetical protein FJ096_09320 [Deltaproteobacteria bacterium]|nr:hypothetical protein [Deltaproteobacteria bacterium]